MQMQFKRGDIIYVDFGNMTGSEQRGIRPAVIIQNNTGNKFSPTLVVAAITTQKKSPIPTHLCLDDYNCGLAKSSTVLAEQVRTVDKNRVLSKVGSINEKCLDGIIAISFGLPVSYSQKQNATYVS